MVGIALAVIAGAAAIAVVVALFAYEWRMHHEKGWGKMGKDVFYP